MKPYGLVAAASTASQMSTPNGRSQKASSLMRAMLTWNSSTAASEAASMPETSLGVFSSVQRGLPGSIRSGL